MATVIYLPKTKGIGESLGEFGAAMVGAEQRKEAKAEKAQQLSQLFDSIQTGDPKAAKKAIASGAVTETSELISLVSALRKGKAGDTIKLDAFDQTGKKVPFAASKQDLATGTAETQAGKLGLTLTNPGKQVDFYLDSPALKYVGTASASSRKGLTMEEWKAKFPSKTPDEKTTNVQDYLKAKNLESTAVNRTRARQYLFKAKAGVEVINSAFGKKTGNDWTFDTPQKSQAAALAKTQLEGLMLNEGLDPRQAGQQAVEIAKKVYAEQAEAGDITALGEEPEEGILDKLQKMIRGGDEEETKEVSLGKIGEQDITYPGNMKSPLEIAKYVSETYDIPFDDVRAWLITNAPDD